jgi:hypothetical protein
LRTLICTYGYRHDKIVKAMRTIDHDELILVTGVENTSRKEYFQILELVQKLDVPVETVTVDIFDFLSCFSTIDDVVRRRQSEKHLVAINISGGLPLLSDAAMMAAFNNGCEAYYVDDVIRKMPMMLPVLKVNIGERLTAEQKMTLMELKEGALVIMSRSPARSPEPRLQALRDLKVMGMITVDLTSGEARVSLTPNGTSIREWLKRC